MWPPLPLPLHWVPHTPTPPHPPAATSSQLCPASGRWTARPASCTLQGRDWVLHCDYFLTSSALSTEAEQTHADRPRVQCWPRPSWRQPQARPLSMTFQTFHPRRGQRGRPCCCGSQGGQGPNGHMGAAVTSASPHAPCWAGFCDHGELRAFPWRFGGRAVERPRYSLQGRLQEVRE